MPLQFSDSRDNWGAWQALAQCAIVDADLFFPREDEGKGPRLRRERRAKEVCFSCPVRTRCQEHAIAVGEPYGIWGGTSESDRRSLRRMKSAQNSGTPAALQTSPHHEPSGNGRQPAATSDRREHVTRSMSETQKRAVQ